VAIIDAVAPDIIDQGTDLASSALQVLPEMPEPRERVSFQMSARPHRSVPMSRAAPSGLAEGDQGPEQRRHGFGAGQHGLGRDAVAEFLIQPLDRVRCPRRSPLWRVEPGKDERPGPCLLEAVGDGLAFLPPFAKECLATFLDLYSGVGADHVAEVVVHRLRRMAGQIAMVLDHAALDDQVLAPERDKCGIKTMGAVDDDELWPLQPARIEVGEVTVDRGLAVKPRLDDGAVRTETDDIFVGEPSTGRFPDPPHYSSAGDNAAAPWSAIQ